MNNSRPISPFPSGSQYSAVVTGQQVYGGAGTPFNVEIGKVGLLSTIWVGVQALYTRTANAGAAATVRTPAQRTQQGFGLSPIIRTLTVQNNINIRPVNTSGFGAWLSGIAAVPDWRADLDAVSGIYSQSAADLALGAGSTLSVGLLIPVLISTSEYGQAGLMANQDTAITYNVSGVWGNPIADVLTGNTDNVTVTATMTISPDYWSIPPAGGNYGLPSLAFSQTFTEQIYTPSANGRFRIDIPGGPAYMSTIIEVANQGDVPFSNAYGPIELYQSANVMLRSTDVISAQGRAYRRIKRVLPGGVLLLDYAHILGGTEAFNDYALMQTQSWTDAHFFVNLPAGWVAGNNSFIRVIHRALVPVGN